MNPIPPIDESQILRVASFQNLVSTPFDGDINALCWSRELSGDFSEIVSKAELTGNITILDEDELNELELTEQGQLARDILLQDLKLLREYGASPNLNIIKCYDTDDTYPFFPTDVYSFHVDRSPVPTDTFLCTYYGESSEIVPNAQAEQKVLIPKIRNELRKLFDGPDDAFDDYLREQFFDLHYQAKQDAEIIPLGIGNVWRLAVDYPGSKVLPCIHRAPLEKNGKYRLMVIC